MNGASCDRCRFWRPSRSSGVAARAQGDCRRDAPRIIFTKGAESTRGVWPTIAGNEWCGKFEDKHSLNGMPC